MSAFLGGFEITLAEGRGQTAIAVTVQTDFTDRYFQLYAGRRLIGVTDTAGETRVVGQLQSAHCPHALTVVMVDDVDRLTDLGSRLPPRPLNQFEVGWTAADFPGDAKWFEITGATAADGEVDPDNVIVRVAFNGNGIYRFTLPPINAPGQWPYIVTSRDDAFPDGNPCPSPPEISEYALPYPPDVAMDEDGNRLTHELAAGTLTVGFEYDWDAP